MIRFSRLLDRLVVTQSHNGKRRLLQEYFAHTPDPDRGHAVAILAGALKMNRIKPAMLRSMISCYMDDVLFELSLDYVGDLKETIALVWDRRGRTAGPFQAGGDRPNSGLGEDGETTLSGIVSKLQKLGKTDAMSQLPQWFDQLDAPGRHALLELLTGGPRSVVSNHDLRCALADFGGVELGEVQEVWHGLNLPYLDLFAWLSGEGTKPAQSTTARFRPFMSISQISKADCDRLNPVNHMAMWKWNGLRVQAVVEGGTRRLYSYLGDDISPAFPDILDAMVFDGSLDGELLPGHAQVHSGVELDIDNFSQLQPRLGRKRVSRALLASHPVFIRAHDLLAKDGQDLRSLPFFDRRKRLEVMIASLNQPQFDLSALLDFRSWRDLEILRKAPPHQAIDGVLIKSQNSVYQSGSAQVPWQMWKREPMRLNTVLMYARRGAGKQVGSYSTLTVGVWTTEQTLVPISQASCGLDEDQLIQADRFVRDNTVKRFGPVRSVTADKDLGLVVEIAFDGLDRSPRRKSGLILRSPRLYRLHPEKSPGEADTLASLEAALLNPIV
jgi:DNA ligase-1